MDSIADTCVDETDRTGEEFNWIIEDDFENLFEIPLQKQVFDFCNSIDILKIFFKIFLKKISH